MIRTHVAGFFFAHVRWWMVDGVLLVFEGELTAIIGGGDGDGGSGLGGNGE